MIKCDKGDLTVRGIRLEVIADGVTILAYLHQNKLLVACLSAFEKMLDDGIIDKVFGEDDD